jgi:hypothetical protein
MAPNADDRFEDGQQGKTDQFGDLFADSDLHRNRTNGPTRTTPSVSSATGRFSLNPHFTTGTRSLTSAR